VAIDITASDKEMPQLLRFAPIKPRLFSNQLRFIAVTRLLEPVRVTVLEGQIPPLLVAGPPPLEIFLSHHVQVSVRRQFCLRRRLLSRLLADRLSRPLLRRSAVSRAMSVERRHPTHDERRRSHHHKKTYRFELSGHTTSFFLIPGSLYWCLNA
jgi:hypothetical protein